MLPRDWRFRRGWFGKIILQTLHNYYWVDATKQDLQKYENERNEEARKELFAKDRENRAEELRHVQKQVWELKHELMLWKTESLKCQSKS